MSPEFFKQNIKSDAFLKNFWAKIDKKGDDECWEWTASRNKGYGNIRFQGKLYISHRVAFELAYGHIDDTLDILHSCDNPPCCNPKHLSQGTTSDNVQDMITKGRQNNVSGEQSPFAKLTWAIIDEIKQQHAQGATILGLAKKYGVTRAPIQQILKGSKWKEENRP